MAKITETLVLKLDTSAVTGLIQGASTVIAEQLRALPRQREPDGSLWVDAELVDALATKLENLQ